MVIKNKLNRNKREGKNFVCGLSMWVYVTLYQLGIERTPRCERVATHVKKIYTRMEVKSISSFIVYQIACFQTKTSLPKELTSVL